MGGRDKPRWRGGGRKGGERGGGEGRGERREGRGRAGAGGEGMFGFLWKHVGVIWGHVGLTLAINLAVHHATIAKPH